ncbi:hypothetical protein [Pedobacter gandavensis]|uniref:hypothetical protein n=1 Tax=Pedobacter gandavensis TaxID=2679963 RepID=UPI00292E7A0D|nr:hypothetical protein [Pedobacter gandavensis]
MKKNKLVYAFAIILAFGSCKKTMNVAPLVEQEMYASPFAGSNVAAFIEGTGTKAAFDRPYSMVVDDSGNLFVADGNTNGGNSRIRKVTPEGVTTTFAGGVIGSLDGTGTSAQFGDGGNVLTIDAQNNLYLADQQNSCIRKITPSGVVSTVAGAPGRANIDGPVATAGIKFLSPADITIDPANNIYFLDIKGIRKVSSTGIVSTPFPIASSNTFGPIATATIANPTGITSDKAGNIYVATRPVNQSVVVKIGIDGIVSLYAGGPMDYNVNVQGPAARFGQLRTLSTDKSGNIYLVDAVYRTYLKIAADRFLSPLAGVPSKPLPSVLFGQGGPAFDVYFLDVQDIAIAPDGTIYVMENIPSSIRKIKLVDKATTPPTQAEIDKATWNKPGTWK